MKAVVLGCLWLLPVALAQAAAPAIAAPETEASRRLEQGMRLYDVRRYKEAIELFQQGYALEPDPQFLFALGQAYRLDGDCSAAVQAFRAYLRTNPLPNRAEVTGRLIALCDVAAPKLPLAPVPVQAPDPLVPASAPAVMKSPSRSRRYAWTFGGVGLTAAALVSAAIVQGVEHASYQSLRGSCAPPAGPGCSDADIAGVQLRMDAAKGLWITGGVLGIATIVTAIVQARHR